MVQPGPRAVASARRGTPAAAGEEVGDIGSEQKTKLSGKQHIASQCDAKCDAIPADHVDLLARAVLLVAGMPIPEASREAVLQRVIEELEQG
ncbi:MAG: hypothetical protein ACKOC4_07685 [Planctomycetia bacterium]